MSRSPTAPSQPVRIGLACDAATFARMATPVAVERLGELGPFSHELFDLPSSWAEPPPANEDAERRLVTFAADLDALLICHGAPRLTADLFTRLPKLRFVAELEGDRFAQHIDFDAAREHGITVVDTSNSSSYAVAEWALALALVGLRNAGALFRRLIAGEVLFKSWEDRYADPGFDGELTGRRVGIIGCGHIGRRLIALLRPFEPVLFVYDPYLSREVADVYDLTVTSLDEVMSCDVVICLAPLTPETRRMIGARELGLLAPGSVFVNVSRGAIVDQDELAARLSRGDCIACLDVFDPDPLAAGSPLRAMPNVFLSPHIAGVTKDCGPRFVTLAADEIARYFAGHQTRYDLVARKPVSP